VRYPGLFLWLFACLVAAGTHLLATAAPPTTGGVWVATAATPPQEGRPESHVEAVSTSSVAERPVTDALLASPMMNHPEFRAEVERWVRFWSTGPREWFPSYLSRMLAFEEMVGDNLHARGLPPSFRYLPIIESGYDPTAVSHASAVGMWQFMEPTARDFGIEVDQWVDDRRDPFISTAAAGDFLVQLYEEFDSWFLALAAYNGGPQRIRGLIRRHAPNAEYSDALYWALREVLPRETREYVPNLIGAITVASDPTRFGYPEPEPALFAFEPVRVFGEVDFETVARATGSTADEIARLNPELVRRRTPALRQVELRLPRGTTRAFADYFEGP